MTLKEILDYEIRSSWWASWISNPYLQSLAGVYFSRKATRKYRRYQLSLKWKKELTQ